VAQSAIQAGKAAEIAAEKKSAKYNGLSSSHNFYSGGCRVSWPIGGRRSSFYYGDWHKNEFQHRGSARNGFPVPTHLSGDSTLQRRVSCNHFHFRTVVVIPDIIIFIAIIVVIIIIIIIIFQASLPVKEGGLGVRRVTSLAPFAFLASASGTETLQQQLLIRSATAATTDPTVTSVRSTWSYVHGLPCPSGVIAHRQSSWDKPVITLERETLTSSLSDSSDNSRLQAVRAPHSGDWLNALPLSACRLRLDDNTIHMAVGLRLGANICEPHQ